MKFEKKRMEVLEVVNQPREIKKQKKSEGGDAREGSEEEDDKGIDKEKETGLKQSLAAIQKLREKDQTMKEKRARAKKE